jgi:hypothetical protein
MLILIVLGFFYKKNMLLKKNVIMTKNYIDKKIKFWLKKYVFLINLNNLNY